MIFFDIDRTLLDHESAERAAALTFQKEHPEVFTESPEKFVERWHTVAEKYIKRHIDGEFSFREQRRIRLKELFGHHRQLSDADADGLFESYLRHYENNWKLYDDVLDCLEELSGYGLGIISNGDSEQQRQKLHNLGIIGMFSTIVISGDIGISKPEAGIFITACERAGVAPDQCYFVGDNLKIDAEAGTKAGLTGIWLNRDGREADTDLPVIFSLRELRGKVV